jgi:hypothetical protein
VNEIDIMKKNLVFLLSFCVAVHALAQIKTLPAIDTSAKFREQLFNGAKVTFGIKVGYTQSDIYGKDVDYIFADSKTNALSSFHGGLTANIMWGKYFWLKHELLVNRKGAAVSLKDSVNGKYSSNLKLVTLDLFPISPTFHFKGFQLYVGPYLSALLNGSINRKDSLGREFSDNKIFGTAKETSKSYKYLQKFDFGIVAGIEYEFDFGLNIGARFTEGFTPVFDNANVYTFNQQKPIIHIYNQALLISVGYSFKRRIVM